LISAIFIVTVVGQLQANHILIHAQQQSGHVISSSRDVMLQASSWLAWWPSVRPSQMRMCLIILC